MGSACDRSSRAFGTCASPDANAPPILRHAAESRALPPLIRPRLRPRLDANHDR